MKKPVKVTLFSIGGIGTVALILAIILGLNYFNNNFGKGMTDLFVWLSDDDIQQPEVKYGEFPFKIVYEINGDQTTIEETLVIEHLGVGFDFAKGKHNKWKSYFLHKENEANLTFERDFVLLDTNNVTIEFTLGCCEYYFGMEEEIYFILNTI